MAMSIQDRISALNIGQVRTGPPPPKPSSSNKPSLPPRLPPRSVSTQDVRLDAEEADVRSIGNQPACDDGLSSAPLHAERPRRPLPPPRPSASSRTPPALPARDNTNTSQALVRRDSTESVSSTLSARSSLSTPSTRTSLTGTSTRSPSIDNGNSLGGKNLRAPAYDAASLPPLPPKRASLPPGRPGLKSRGSSASTTRTIPPRPPLLPSRQDSTTPNTTPPPAPLRRDTPPSLPQRALQQVSEPAQPALQQTSIRSIPPKRSALSYGMNQSTEQAPVLPQRPGLSGVQSDTWSTPPPVPMSSRPNLAALQASKPKAPFNTTSPSAPPLDDVCGKCRDYSGPDNHAARFPRDSLPSQNIQWLGQQLTAPFTSHTDKARALFTWCHHNIAYDVVAFFGKNIQRSTPNSTVATGLAVCEGYAALFTALALASGMEAVLITGHGMGFGTKFTEVNDPTPPENATGHAWNVVKIDGGEWKLIDVCWGAGNVCDNPVSYTKSFKPEQFYMSNDEFGKRHYPKDPAHQFRNDGRVMSWDEYTRGGYEPKFDKVTIYNECFSRHGLDEHSFVPAAKQIQVRGVSANQRIQFSFKKYCPHWDIVKHGPGRPYLMFLSIGGRDGRKKDMIPIRCDPSYSNWWVDVATQDLGAPGQTITITTLSELNGRDARGMTAREFEDKKRNGGASSWCHLDIAAYELV